MCACVSTSVGKHGRYALVRVFDVLVTARFYKARVWCDQIKTAVCWMGRKWERTQQHQQQGFSVIPSRTHRVLERLVHLEVLNHVMLEPEAHRASLESAPKIKDVEECVR